MGQRVGSRLNYLRKMGLPLLLFSFVMPPLHGILTLVLSSMAGLSVGGATVMATLAASASYITAPAVVEANIPDVDITPALTASLVLTFPFNLIIGLPLYYELAKVFI